MNRALVNASASACTAALFGLAAPLARADDATVPARAPAVAAAASAAATAAEADAAASRQPGEPAVRHTVIQDESARIDELRVRGQLTRVTVDPKGRLPAYEILTVDGARDLSDGPSPSRGAAGKRVWNVFRF